MQMFIPLLRKEHVSWAKVFYNVSVITHHGSTPSQSHSTAVSSEVWQENSTSWGKCPKKCGTWWNRWSGAQTKSKRPKEMTTKANYNDQKMYLFTKRLNNAIHTFYFTTLEMLPCKSKWVLNEIELQHSTNCVQPNLVCNIKTTNTVKPRFKRKIRQPEFFFKRGFS